MSTPWGEWAMGVLVEIGAPSSAENFATLNRWSLAESGADLMRWNNPLNTTQPAPGAVLENIVGVKRYPDVLTGIHATSQTLLNGRYPAIVDHLRRSLPASAWQDCCSELETWGTGCGWIGEEGDLEMDQQTFNALMDGYFEGAVAPGQLGVPGELAATLETAQQLVNQVNEVAAKLGQLQAGQPTAPEVLAQVLAGVQRIEAALHQA